MKTSEKQERKELRRHARLKRIFAVLMRIVRPVAKHKFNLTYETLEDIEGPYLVLSNHTTDWDCIFVGLASTRQLYFVATEKLARMGFGGWLVRKLFDPILHYKGRQGTNTVKAIYKHVRRGHNVALFPEGNRSFNGETCPIPPATGKMARMCGATLVTYRWNGGYFSSPRWGGSLRKGKIEGHIAGIYTHEKLMTMTDEEIKSTIEHDLYVNAYEDQNKERVAYIGKRMAEGLESMLFMCPVCGRIGTLKSDNDVLFCTEPACCFQAWYDQYGYLNCSEIPYSEKEQSGSGRYVETLIELDRKQRESIENTYRRVSGTAGRKDEEPIFGDYVTCEKIDSEHSCCSKTAEMMTAYHDRLEIGPEKVYYDKIDGIAVNQQNLLLIHPADCDYHFECSGPKSFSALKYLYICRAAKGSVNGIL